MRQHVWLFHVLSEHISEEDGPFFAAFVGSVGLVVFHFSFVERVEQLNGNISCFFWNDSHFGGEPTGGEDSPHFRSGESVSVCDKPFCTPEEIEKASLVRAFAEVAAAVNPIRDIKTEIEAKGYPVELGIVQRTGACGPIDSIYLRDPDENLVEISVYKE